jgi:Tol biopolymer transport system component/DNA-binding winged helix-turn-helix (wHTH) protein
MRHAASSSDVIRFGPFTVDLRTQELRRCGLPIRLPGQSFEVLKALLTRPGELVTREELQRQLWPSDSFGDFDHGINAAVNRVRDALSDHAEAPRYIETLPRRGYRFIGEVASRPVDTVLAGGATDIESPTPLQPPGTSVQWQNSARKRNRSLLAATVLIAVAIVIALFIHREREVDRSIVTSEAGTITPLTSLPGTEISPTFSPDGSQIAFGWDGDHGKPANRFDLYVKVVGAERVERLTHDPAHDLAAAWSPDATTIAFTRETMHGTVSSVGLFLIPARGGPERKLAETSYSYSVLPAGLSWSPDGGELLYSFDWKIHVVVPATGAVRDFPVSTSCSRPFAPAISPDGVTVVFGCYVAEAITDFYTLPRAGGKATFLVRPPGVTTSLIWSHDGRRLLFENAGGLFEIAKEGGVPHPLPFGQDGFSPALAPHADRLAYVKPSFTVNLWRVDVSGPKPNTRSVLVPTTREQRQPAIAPDGKRPAFESERSGYHEVWVANLDGADAVQLTHFRQHNGTGSPKWSPDGQEIVFDSRVSGRPALYLVNPATASPNVIPVADLDPSVPTWSRDGRWIYFRSGNPARPGVYKIARQGGSPVRVTPTDAMNALESADGKLLYFVDPHGEIRVRSLIATEEHPLIGIPRLRAPTDWVLTATGLFLINVNHPKAAPSIDFFDLAKARITRSIPLEKSPAYFGGLSLSPDGTWLAYSQVDAEVSDLMLVEGFR